MFRSEHIQIAPEFRELLRDNGLVSVADVYRLTSGTIVIASGTTEVRRLELRSPSGNQIVFLKKYWTTHPRQLWSGMLRGTFFGWSKVHREYHNLNWLCSAGLDAPAPVAYGEERRTGWLVRSFLISASVPEPQPLHEYIRERLPILPFPEHRRARQSLINRLADYTRRMHEKKFVHHDYFWRNILLKGDSLDHFYLIDAHKGRVWPAWRETASRVADLAALDAPAPRFFRRTERLQFFLRYLNKTRLDHSAKQILHKTLTAAAPLRERQTRRALGLGRPAKSDQ